MDSDVVKNAILETKLATTAGSSRRPLSPGGGGHSSPMTAGILLTI
jgi:hypothetical protein